MATPLANPAAIDLVYEDLKEVLDVTTKGFCRRFGTEYEETRARANMIFVETIEHYPRDGKQSVATWMRYCVWYLLIDDMRRDFTKARRPVTGFAGPAALEAVAAPVQGSSVVDDFGPDAAFVARLAIDTPEALQSEIRARGGAGRNARAVLRRHLLEQGWTTERVNKAFEEIAGGTNTETVSRRGRCEANPVQGA